MTNDLRPCPEHKDPRLTQEMGDNLYSDPLREPRDDYYIQYLPPATGGLFAVLQLTFIASVDKSLDLDWRIPRAWFDHSETQIANVIDIKCSLHPAMVLADCLGDACILEVAA